MVKFICPSCNIRVPANRPLLTCSICNCFKHYKCNNLSILEAEDIVQCQQSHWTCQDCYQSIFPNYVDSDDAQIQNQEPIVTHTAVKCGACNKLCSSKQVNTSVCPWCDQLCHKRCIKGELGCSSCAADMIPGYFYQAHALSY